tara:strand:+ start:108 stop:644 length:537 start_codon:yes stop_codon:yes gene_type:complete
MKIIAPFSVSRVASEAALAWRHRRRKLSSCWKECSSVPVPDGLVWANIPEAIELHMRLGRRFQEPDMLEAPMRRVGADGRLEAPTSFCPGRPPPKAKPKSKRTPGGPKTYTNSRKPRSGEDIGTTGKSELPGPTCPWPSKASFGGQNIDAKLDAKDAHGRVPSRPVVHVPTQSGMGDF